MFSKVALSSITVFPYPSLPRTIEISSALLFSYRLNTANKKEKKENLHGTNFNNTSAALTLNRKSFTTSFALRLKGFLEPLRLRCTDLKISNDNRVLNHVTGHGLQHKALSPSLTSIIIIIIGQSLLVQEVSCRASGHHLWPRMLCTFCSFLF